MHGKQSSGGPKLIVYKVACKVEVTFLGSYRRTQTYLGRTRKYNRNGSRIFS
jgi:hypothetical protein